ncbi:MAG TPA: FecR family protein, partial [Arachidicoccus sp.]
MTNERFTELLTKYLTEQISSDEYSELEYLASTDESLRDQFDYFKVFWKKNPAKYNNSDALFTKIKSRINTTSQHSKAAPAPSIKYWRAIAAALILGIAFFSLYQFAYKSSAQKNGSLLVKNVLPGKKSTIILADGTKVTLNAESSLKYPTAFSAGTRDVYLTGEAFFDVHKDHQHPFIVHTAKMNVRVLGTAFDVKSYNNDSSSETTLIRGMIEVTLADRPSDRIILK